MDILIQCGSCRTQAPSIPSEEDGRPDIPEGWSALHAKSDPRYEVYACCDDCALILGFILSKSYPGDAIMARQVEVVWKQTYE